MRTGEFGQQPRSAPSLTNTLVAIAREFQSQRAQNIMDAWQKGGQFEGKKATDEVVLKFWQDRAKGVSKDDPLYDTYHNAFTQLDYTIHESKMTAAYAQGKATDGAMVSFYLNWAKKVPKNSEFFRVLQRDAGQYMRNQRAKNEADARRRAEEAYQRQQSDTRKGKEAAGEYVIDTLRRIAQSGYVDGGIAPAIAAPGSGSDLTDFDPSDPQAMLKLIAAIVPQTVSGDTSLEKNTVNSANKGVIYHDDDGNPVTGVDIMKKLSGLDPTFTPGAPFNVDYVTGLLDRQMQGLNERIARATKTGHMTDATNLSKDKQYVALLNREVAAYPIQKAYQEARSDYDAVVSDKSSSPQAVLNAWQTYQSTLLTLADDPRIQADDNMRSRLTAEANGDGSVATLNESFTGLSNESANAGSVKDSAENAKAIEFMQAQVDAVASGQAYWTYGQTNSNGVFEPRAGGREIGAATPDAVDAGGVSRTTIMVPDPRGGPPLPMLVTAVPVFASAKDPKTGEYLSPTNANPIAYAYDLPNGSGTKTMYGFDTAEGRVYSSDPPWDDRLKTVSSASGGNHIEVDLTPIVAQQQANPAFSMVTNQDLKNGFYVKDVPAKGGEGKLVFDPQSATWATDTRKDLGSTDPTSDFTSLTLATLMATPDGRSIINNLDQNPKFKAQLTYDAYTYAGYQQDMKTGQWMPVAGADPNKLNKALMQGGAAQRTTSFLDFVNEQGGAWQRLLTGNPFKPETVGHGGTTGASPDLTANGFTKLATDLLQGTPFEALSKVFLPGTSTLKPVNVNDQTGFVIKPTGTIKTPTIPNVNAATGFNLPPVAPTKPIAPPQAGSQPPSQTSSQPPPGSTYQQNQGQTYGGGV